MSVSLSDNSGEAPTAPSMHLPSLAVGLTIMVSGTVHPPMMANASGRASRGLATLLSGP